MFVEVDYNVTEDGDILLEILDSSNFVVACDLSDLNSIMMETLNSDARVISFSSIISDSFEPKTLNSNARVISFSSIISDSVEPKTFLSDPVIISFSSVEDAGVLSQILSSANTIITYTTKDLEDACPVNIKQSNAFSGLYNLYADIENEGFSLQSHNFLSSAKVDANVSVLMNAWYINFFILHYNLQPSLVAMTQTKTRNNFEVLFDTLLSEEIQTAIKESDYFTTEFVIEEISGGSCLLKTSVNTPVMYSMQIIIENVMAIFASKTLQLNYNFYENEDVSGYIKPSLTTLLTFYIMLVCYNDIVLKNTKTVSSTYIIDSVFTSLFTNASKTAKLIDYDDLLLETMDNKPIWRISINK